MVKLDKPWTVGYYNVELEDDVRELLASVSDLMIPGSADFPRASDAGVAKFIEGRISPEEAAILASLLRAAAVDPAWHADAEGVLRSREHEDRDAFALLRFYVYSGYYSSLEVALAIKRLGYDYQPVPQPFGYRVDHPVPMPNPTVK